MCLPNRVNIVRRFTVEQLRRSSQSRSERPKFTKAQYLAGRKDLDSVDHAQMDRDAAETELEKLASERVLAQWEAVRVLFPRQFPAALMQQLHLGKVCTGGSECSRW
jgi:hypothetical protein